LNGALQVARAAIETPRCQAAFSHAFPEWGADADWPEAFASVHFAPTEPIADRPNVAAFTQCDVSTDTVMIVRRWYMWQSKKRVARYLIHEFVHLVSCPAIFMTWEHQVNVPAEGMQELEQLAYDIAGICIGE
jgi:hypothetical protein